jgi:hypothetical protein
MQPIRARGALQQLKLGIDTGGTYTDALAATAC